MRRLRPRSRTTLNELLASDRGLICRRGSTNSLLKRSAYPCSWNVQVPELGPAPSLPRMPLASHRQKDSCLPRKQSRGALWDILMSVHWFSYAWSVNGWALLNNLLRILHCLFQSQKQNLSPLLGKKYIGVHMHPSWCANCILMSYNYKEGG